MHPRLDVQEQRWDELAYRSCLDSSYALTRRAAQLGANMPDHLEARRYVLQHLRHVFAEPAQLGAAIGTNALSGFVLVGLARQVLWQWPSRRSRRYKKVRGGIRLAPRLLPTTRS